MKYHIHHRHRGQPDTVFDHTSSAPNYKTNGICKGILPTQVTPEIAFKRLTYLVALKVLLGQDNPCLKSESWTSTAVPGRPALKFDGTSKKPGYKTNRCWEGVVPSFNTPVITSKTGDLLGTVEGAVGTGQSV